LFLPANARYSASGSSLLSLCGSPSMPQDELRDEEFVMISVPGWRTIAAKQMLHGVYSKIAKGFA